MDEHQKLFESELLEAPTAVMRQYLAHFEVDAHGFCGEIATTAAIWKQFATAAVAQEKKKEHLEWAAAYLLNAINFALVSSRLFLSGYIAPSGNQARQALESMAFGVLLCFPATGAYREWMQGRNIEHKALEWLNKSAAICGVDRQNAHELKEQSKWFDHYSHPSRLSLATIWNPEHKDSWNVGALFVEEYLPQYRDEMANRISLAKLVGHTIAGAHAQLIGQGLI